MSWTTQNTRKNKKKESLEINYIGKKFKIVAFFYVQNPDYGCIYY
jgi:hypothetical protein